MKPIGIAFIAATLVLGTPSGLRAADDPSWESVKNAKSELSFLETLSAYALQCPPEAYPKALKEAAEFSESHRQTVAFLLLGAWVERQPEEVERYLEKNATKIPSAGLFGAVDLLAKHDFNLAMHLADSFPPASGMRKDVQVAALLGFAAKQPTPAIDLVLSRPDFRDFFPTLIQNIALSNPNVAIKSLAQISDEELRANVKKSATHAWVNKDPEAALAWATKEFPEQEFGSFVFEAAPAIAALGPQKAQEILNLHAPKKEAEELQKKVFAIIIDRAPDEAILWIDAHPDTAIDHLMRRQVVEYFARKAPLKAASQLRALPSGELPSPAVIKTVLTGWAMAAPTEARKWAECLPDGELRDDALSRVNTMLIFADEETAKSQALDLPPGPLRAKMTRNTALTLGRKDLGRAMEWIDTFPEGPDKSKALDGMWYLGIERDPQRLAELSVKLKKSERRDSFVVATARRWVQLDPGAAFKWYRTLPATEDRKKILYQMVVDVGTYEPNDLLEFAQTSATLEEKQAIASKMSQFPRTPELVAALKEALPANYALEDSGVITELAATDPQEAARRLTASAQSANDLRLAEIVAEIWARRDPAAAARFLLSFPPNDKGLRPSVQRLAAAWATVDSQAAAAWVATISDPSQRSIAAQNVTKQLMHGRPKSAFDLAVQNLPPASTTLTDIVKYWAESDPAAATLHVEASALAPEIKTKLLNAIRTP